MSSELADGVLAIVRAATEPLFERIKSLESEVARVKAAAPADVSTLIDAAVSKALAAVPGPKDGRDGRDGVDGAKGADGKDGVGLASALIARDGELIVTLTDGATKSLGVVVGAKGADGAPGTNGRDGVGHDDVEESYEDDGRVLVRKYLRDGQPVREFRHVTKQSIYRGVYEAGKQYQEGDETTWGGSLWQAKETTTAKPGDASAAARAWVLKVKRGADGKKGDQGIEGKKGEKGDQGERGPAKWS